MQYFWTELMVGNAVKMDNLDVWPLICRKQSAFDIQFHLIVVSTV